MNTNTKLYRSITGLAFVTGLLLLIPLISMQFSNEVAWTLSDFVLAGSLLFGTGLIYKLITRKSAKTAYRLGIGLALSTGLFLIWANLAVGLIGSEDNAINLIYFGIVGVGIMGAFTTRFQARKMIFVLFATALGQGLATIIALLTEARHLPGSSVVEILTINGFFMVLWSLSALFLRHAAQD